MLGVSHTAVIYWVKKAGEQIKEIVFEQRKPEKADILEFDEMCVNLKKFNKKWIWLAVERYSQKIKGFFVGSRDNLSFENLSKNIERIDAKIYATDAWDSYNLINPKNHVVGKSYTYTVERTDRLLCHYLARFARKTYSISKSLSQNKHKRCIIALG